MNDPRIEHHPLAPFLPQEAKVLLLGSFPPGNIRWSMDFYYPNIQNDMWRIMGLIFFGNKDHFLLDSKKAFHEAQIRTFYREKGIAISDTARSVIRLNGNASDKFLQIVEPLDLKELLSQIPDCHTIVTTGQKATDTLLPLINSPEPAIGSCSEFIFMDRAMRLYRMPSSSRAYPKPLTEKAALYETMYREIGIL